MAKNLQQEANAAASYLARSTRQFPQGDALRDFVDGWTQGDLDAMQLDILTDMIAARLIKIRRDVHGQGRAVIEVQNEKIH